MKLIIYSKYDWVLQLIILPVYIGLLNWILLGSLYWENWLTLVLASGLALITSFSIWTINNIIALRLNKLFPDLRQYMVRTIWRYVATSTNSSLHVLLLFAVYRFIDLPGFEPTTNRLGFAILYTLIILAIVVVTYESMDNFGHWQRSRGEIDVLTKAQLQTQLDALRQQVNPHFLFNSLNSLISLIDEDPQQAGTFAEELSTVYRYLLRSNDSPLVPLSSELAFIQSYYHLLKTRHGDSISLTTRIQMGAETRQLPPLTLQLLIENAVKHNIILPEQPLVITLTATENQLTVSNNLQRKSSKALSNGVGLDNIMKKYQILGQPVPTIVDDGHEFVVTLPLL